MRFADPRPYADPDAAARKLLEIANGIDPVYDGRVYIELINAPMLALGSPPKGYRAGLHLAIARGWLVLHESGTYVRFTQAGSDLFA